MSTALKVELELTTISCGACGGTYAITERYRAHKYEHKSSWHCPYCQISWGYVGKTETQKLQEQLAAEKARHAATLSRENALRQKQDKLAKRVKNGVCPCCTRSFTNLKRHIASKHPEYAK